MNKMDRIGADFFASVNLWWIDLGATPVPSNCPSVAKATSRASIDLVTMKAYVYDDESLGAKYKVEEIPANLLELAKEYREKMLECSGRIRRAGVGKIFKWRPASEEEIKKAIRAGAISMKILPILCGASFKNKGVQQLLDGVVDFFHHHWIFPR